MPNLEGSEILGVAMAYCHIPGVRDMLHDGNGSKQKRKKVSAEQVAADLAQDGHTKRLPRAQSSFSSRSSVDRESSDALPSGHPLSWGALWQTEAVPLFPGLMPMGMPDAGIRERSPVVW